MHQLESKRIRAFDKPHATLLARRIGVHNARRGQSDARGSSVHQSMILYQRHALLARSRCSPFPFRRSTILLRTIVPRRSTYVLRHLRTYLYRSLSHPDSLAPSRLIVTTSGGSSAGLALMKVAQCIRISAPSYTRTLQHQIFKLRATTRPYIHSCLVGPPLALFLRRCSSLPSIKPSR